MGPRVYTTLALMITEYYIRGFFCFCEVVEDEERILTIGGSITNKQSV